VLPSSASSGLGVAIAGLVLGIVGVLLELFALRILVALIGLACVVVAIVCGHVAHSRPASSPGRGLAIAVLCVGYLGLVIGVAHLTVLAIRLRLFRRLHFS
jgi:hypothetical protein